MPNDARINRQRQNEDNYKVEDLFFVMNADLPDIAVALFNRGPDNARTRTNRHP